jgi:hypothetical protein
MAEAFPVVFALYPRVTQIQTVESRARLLQPRRSGRLPEAAIPLGWRAGLSRGAPDVGYTPRCARTSP